MASRRNPAVPDELLDRLLDGSDALEAFQSGDLVQDLKKALAERILMVYRTALRVGHPLENLYRRVRAMRLAEGVCDILRLYPARGRLDLNKGRI